MLVGLLYFVERRRAAWTAGSAGWSAAARLRAAAAVAAASAWLSTAWALALLRLPRAAAAGQGRAVLQLPTPAAGCRGRFKRRSSATRTSSASSSGASSAWTSPTSSSASTSRPPPATGARTRGRAPLGRRPRGSYLHVGEFICLASLFTTLKYYPSQGALFVDRLLRYARTVPARRAAGSCSSTCSAAQGRRTGSQVVRWRSTASIPAAGTVEEHILDASVSARARQPGLAGARGRHARELRADRARSPLTRATARARAILGAGRDSRAMRVPGGSGAKDGSALRPHGVRQSGSPGAPGLGPGRQPRADAPGAGPLPLLRRAAPGGRGARARPRGPRGSPTSATARSRLASTRRRRRCSSRRRSRCRSRTGSWVCRGGYASECIRRCSRPIAAARRRPGCSSTMPTRPAASRCTT